MKSIMSLITLTILTYMLNAQVTDSLAIIVSGLETQELRDLFHFQEIGYIKVDLCGTGIKDDHFLLISKEYRNKSLINTDTIADTRIHNFKNGSDTVRIRFTTQKVSEDSVKIQFGLPRFLTSKKYGATMSDMYAVIPLSQRKGTLYAKDKPIDILAYSLPYPFPGYLGAYSYCELKSNGVKSEDWGNKYDVEHYIIFSFQLLQKR